NNLFGGSAVGSNSPTASALGAGSGEAGALDTLAASFITDISHPMELVLSAFCYIAAGVLLVVAIHRLTKKDEGPRGPAGFGTIMTFIVSGVLFSIGDSIGAFTSSIFGDSVIAIRPTIDTSIGLGDVTRVETTIQVV